LEYCVGLMEKTFHPDSDNTQSSNGIFVGEIMPAQALLDLKSLPFPDPLGPVPGEFFSAQMYAKWEIGDKTNRNVYEKMLEIGGQAL